MWGYHLGGMLITNKKVLTHPVKVARRQGAKVRLRVHGLDQAVYRSSGIMGINLPGGAWLDFQLILNDSNGEVIRHSWSLA